MPKIDVALVYDDGRKEVVSVGRPADLIAFADKFDKPGPDGPQVVREAVWLAHRALKIEAPVDEWVETLDDVLVGDAVATVRDELADADPGEAAAEAATQIRQVSGKRSHA